MRLCARRHRLIPIDGKWKLRNVAVVNAKAGDVPPPRPFFPVGEVLAEAVGESVGHGRSGLQLSGSVTVRFNENAL